MPAGISTSLSSYPPFTPPGISGCILWLRSDLGVGLNGSTVSRWNDFSGSSNHTTQGTVANQPTYVQNGGAKGLPYLYWPTALSGQNIWGSAMLSQPSEYFIVARTTTAAPANDAYLFNSANNTNNPFNSVIQQSGVLVLNQFGGPGGVEGPNVNVTNNVDFVIDAIGNGNSSSLALNGGAPKNIGGNMSGTGTGFTIGNVYQSGIKSWQGFIYEVVCFNRQLASGERSVLQAYFLARYNLPVTP
jgi:hypothetical protein